MYADPQTLRRLEDDYVGFWVQYRYEEGYGGQLSLGLNGAPFSADYAILRHNLDFSDSWEYTNERQPSLHKLFLNMLGEQNQSRQWMSA